MMGFEQRDHWNAAMLHLRLALDLLDSSDAPAIVGARLDQAVDALEKELRRSAASQDHQVRLPAW